MPYCGNCGKSMIENQNYCPNCGQRAAQSAALVRIGTLCSYCQKPIEKSESVLSCPQCNTPHHQECWQENHGCSVYGCADYGFAGSPVSGPAIAEGGKAKGEGGSPAPADWNPYPMLVSLILLLAIASAGIMTAPTATDTATDAAAGSLSIDVNRITVSPIKTIAEALGERMEQARDDHASMLADQAAPAQEPSTPGYRIIRAAYCIEGCHLDNSMGGHDENDLAAGAEAGHPGVARCSIWVFSEPAFDSSVAWYAKAGDSMYLVDKHNNQYYGNAPGSYVFWEVENMQTGQRGWFAREWIWVDEKGWVCNEVRSLMDKGVISTENLMSYEEVWSD